MNFTRLSPILIKSVLKVIPFSPLPLKTCKHHFSVSICAWCNVKMTRMLEKMIRKKTQGSKKKTWYLTSTSSERSFLGKQSTVPRYSDGQRRRATHVGRVLFDYISDLISTGEVEPLLVEQAVEIVKAVVSPDFSLVQVYWLSSGDEIADKQIQEILDKNSKRIRHLLCSYRVIANVPELVFIRDTSVARLSEIIQLLKVADFGPDDDMELSSGNRVKIMSTDPTHSDFGKPRQSIKKKMAQDFERMSQAMSDVDLSKFSNVTYMGQYEHDSSVKSDISNVDVKSTDQLALQNRVEMLNSANTSQCSSLPQASEINAVAMPDLKFRNNLYEIDHSTFKNQVMIAKQKTKDRNFNWSEKELQDSENNIDSKEHFNGWSSDAYKKLQRMKNPIFRDFPTNIRYMEDFSDNNGDWNRSLRAEDDYDYDASEENP